MTNDPLPQLLASADATAGTFPPSPNGLADRVRAQLRRRQVRARTAAGAAVAVILVVASAIPLLHLKTHAPPVVIDGPATGVRQRDVTRLRDEIAALRAQAATGETTVAAMLRAEQRARQPSPARAATTDPVQRIRDQQDLAALALVRQADRLYRELDHRQSATTAYERVVALFPQTPSAIVARQRLVEIKG
jgi:hypothetical protein